MLTVRPAEIDDAPAIAKVHVETWRSAFTGIIPQAYLDSMTVQNRTFVWVRLLEGQGPAAITLVSEDHDRRVIGFVSGGPLRHRDGRYQAEISSLYVLASHQRGNHGRRLFLAASDRLARSGLQGLFAWTLADGPALGFYKDLGGEVVAETVRDFAGTPLKELGFGWKETPAYG